MSFVHLKNEKNDLKVSPGVSKHKSKGLTFFLAMEIFTYFIQLHFHFPVYNCKPDSFTNSWIILVSFGHGKQI